MKIKNVSVSKIAIGAAVAGALLATVFIAASSYKSYKDMQEWSDADY